MNIELAFAEVLITDEMAGDLGIDLTKLLIAKFETKLSALRDWA